MGASSIARRNAGGEHGTFAILDAWAVALEARSQQLLHAGDLRQQNIQLLELTRGKCTPAGCRWSGFRKAAQECADLGDRKIRGPCDRNDAQPINGFSALSTLAGLSGGFRQIHVRDDSDRSGRGRVRVRDLLRNFDDGHVLPVFDEKIRHRTDQIVLKFRKPS